MTEGIAVYAVAVSTLSLITSAAAALVAWRAYRSGEPRLRPTSHLRPGGAHEVAELRITVKNSGRAAGEVRGITLNVPGPHTISLGNSPTLHGPALPELIPPHSLRTWAVKVDDILEVTNRNGWPHQVRAVITTGGQKQEWESVHAYTNLLSG